jgi:hypothetical protein
MIALTTIFERSFKALIQYSANSKSVPDSHSLPYQRPNQKDRSHGLDH